MPGGWIKLHRKLQDCWIWNEKEPFDKRSAWTDLLLSAMHSDKKRLIDNEVEIIKRGSFMTSVVKLSERWKWSRGKVNRFLELLESEQMITTKRTTRGTLITIVNYEVYQCLDGCDDASDSTTYGTSNSTADSTQNKNDKNVKSDNKNIMCKKDAQDLFERLWQLYPVKKGKAQVSIAAKQRLLKVGYDEMVRAIDRYKAELEKDSDWRKPQNGSTFFNKGYIDYLDANYSPDKRRHPKSKNSFNDFHHRDYDFGELEKKLMERGQT